MMVNCTSDTVSIGEMMNIGLDHIVLNVENIDSMIDFYTDVVGLSTERLLEFRAGLVPFPSVRVNQHTIIDFFPKSMWGQEVTGGSGFNHLNHFCFTLDKKDWDMLCQRLKSHNVSIKEGPVDRWGAQGIGTSIYILDPERNMLEARYYSKCASS